MIGIFANAFRVAARSEDQSKSDSYETHKDRRIRKAEEKRLQDQMYLTRYRGW